MKAYYDVPAGNTHIVPMLIQLAVKNKWITPSSVKTYLADATRLSFKTNANVSYRITWTDSLEYPEYYGKKLSLEETISLLSEPPKPDPELFIGAHNVKIGASEIRVGCHTFNRLTLAKIAQIVKDIVEADYLMISCRVLSNDTIRSLKALSASRYKDSYTHVTDQWMYFTPKTKSVGSSQNRPPTSYTVDLESFILCLINRNIFRYQIYGTTFDFDLKNHTVKLYEEEQTISFSQFNKIYEAFQNQ